MEFACLFASLILFGWAMLERAERKSLRRELIGARKRADENHASFCGKIKDCGVLRVALIEIMDRASTALDEKEPSNAP